MQRWLFPFLLPVGYQAVCVVAQSTAGAYGQCGGSGYTGPTACVSGYTCTTYNAYYYQCIPGAATTTASSSSSVSSSTAVTTTTTTTAATSTTSPSSSSSSSKPTSTATATTTTIPGPATTTTAVSATSSSGSGTPTTLLSGWYWIRAVESPYYHSYLQTLPTATPGQDAVLDAGATAGQFNILDGQLVYNTGAGTTDALYLGVEDPAGNTTQRTLQTWFATTANTYGTFAFSGDTVTWADPDLSNRNEGAFYVCPSNASSSTGSGGAGANALFVNTGAYAYDTPSGCYDVDIHSYGGSTADA